MTARDAATLAWFQTYIKYEMRPWDMFDYSVLREIKAVKRAGRKRNENRVNECWIMLDTETSKEKPNPVIDGQYKAVNNYVVAFTISVRAWHTNIVTLYGNKPSEAIQSVQKIHHSLPGDETIIYVHNLSYDWVFLRKWFFQSFGYPVKQLNTKPHYPIYIEFDNGITLKDSLILAQRSLEKWANDLDVEHKKAVGSWDYNLIRHQDHTFTTEELHYIENDTLAGVECLDKTADQLHKHVYSMPYTATGIPRAETRTRGKPNMAHERFQKMALDFEEYQNMLQVYHGGYTHGNRNYVNEVIEGPVTCYDFASSYPYVMLSEKFPMEKFTECGTLYIDDILSDSLDRAWYFKLIMIHPSLKFDQPMPAMQYSKCERVINPILDNGRILEADYVEIWLTEIDLEVIDHQYDCDGHICCNVHFAAKEYLPRWFTDYIYECFVDKTRLKGGDPVAYALAKARINSCYGMTVQRPIRDDVQENYDTGEYETISAATEDDYDKFCNRFTSILPYQWGTWITAYAFRNLFELGACAGTWLYSDTDSCYGKDWNQAKIIRYNNICKQKLCRNGYKAVYHNHREYWLGVAEFDGEYSEFKFLGAKRYCGRDAKTGKLKITVAGVPKNGAACLNDDINNFRPGFVFPGLKTGKKTHTYIYLDDIQTNAAGDEVGDSVDLTPCDYLLDSIEMADWDQIFQEEVNIQVYE